jgi:hypothetical protein
MFEKLMYIRTIVRAIVGKMFFAYTWQEAFDKSVEITRQEINWVKYFGKKAAK